jgi:hypothetical protein
VHSQPIGIVIANCGSTVGSLPLYRSHKKERDTTNEREAEGREEGQNEFTKFEFVRWIISEPFTLFWSVYYTFSREFSKKCLSSSAAAAYCLYHYSSAARVTSQYQCIDDRGCSRYL